MEINKLDLYSRRAKRIVGEWSAQFRDQEHKEPTVEDLRDNLKLVTEMRGVGCKTLAEIKYAMEECGIIDPQPFAPPIPIPTVPQFAVLSDREQQICNLRNSHLTLSQIGLKMGISGERVRQIFAVAQRKIRYNERHFPER